MTQIVENPMVVDSAWPDEFSPWANADDEATEKYLLETEQASAMVHEYMEYGDWAELYMALDAGIKRRIFRAYVKRHNLEPGYNEWWYDNHGEDCR